MSARYSMRNFPFPITIGISIPDGRSLDPLIQVRIVARLRDRNTGRPVDIAFADALPFLGFASARFSITMLDDFIFRSVEKVVLHEVAECFHLDGVRVHDPHRHEPGYVRTSAPPPGYDGPVPPGGFREPVRPTMKDFLRARDPSEKADR